MHYRKDIQILRGVAVLLVVFFHLGFSGFSSGFLGVDVFFVISGYLMAVMYDPQKKYDFFLKRANRLLPAYFVVVGFTFFVAILVAKPNDYSEVSKQAGFALVFLSNIGFWLDNSYFDKSAFKPLLHLWSLGVEIQFYLFVPVLYWFFKKFKAGYFFVILISAALCFWLVGLSPKTSFFWMPLRLWEFLIGYGVAKYSQGTRTNNALTSSWIGATATLVIIGVPFFPVDGTAIGFLHGHPGIASLGICLASAAALAFGLPARLEATNLASLLERVGARSYSIYLAHFPVIVLFLYKPFKGTTTKSDNAWQLFFLVVLLVVASEAIYKFVERPFRSKKSSLTFSVYTAAALLAIIPFGAYLQRAIYPKNEYLVYQAWGDRSVYRCGTLNRIFHPMANSCELTHGLPEQNRGILLVGNSHADAIKTTFAKVATDSSVRVYFLSGNTPLMPGGISAEGIVSEAKFRGVDTIVLHYASRTLGSDALAKMAQIARRDKLTLVLIKPVPVWIDVVPFLILQKMEGKFLPPFDINDARLQNVELESAIKENPSIKAFDSSEIFCDPVCALMNVDGKPLYFDTNHLTLTGSDLLRPIFERVIKTTETAYSSS